jgi:hypothetical protein
MPALGMKTRCVEHLPWSPELGVAAARAIVEHLVDDREAWGSGGCTVLCSPKKRSFVGFDDRSSTRVNVSVLVVGRVSVAVHLS